MTNLYACSEAKLIVRESFLPFLRTQMEGSEGVPNVFLERMMDDILDPENIMVNHVAPQLGRMLNGAGHAFSKFTPSKDPNLLPFYPSEVSSVAVKGDAGRLILRLIKQQTYGKGRDQRQVDPVTYALGITETENLTYRLASKSREANPWLDTISDRITPRTYGLSSEKERKFFIDTLDTVHDLMARTLAQAAYMPDLLSRPGAMYLRAQLKSFTVAADSFNRMAKRDPQLLTTFEGVA